MGADPAVDVVAWVLVFPVRHAYAALWRAGLVKVIEPPASATVGAEAADVAKSSHRHPVAGAVAAAVVAAIAVSSAVA